MIDVTVVGSGPNGLAAAVTLAAAGLEVRVLERADTAGGGMRTAELTLPGFRHDLCSAVHPAALASPFFRAFRLTERVPFVVPDASYGHPLDDRPAGIAYRNLAWTAAELGRDGPAWTRLFAPLVSRIDALAALTGDTLLRYPAHPVTAARLAQRALEQGSPLWNIRFTEPTAGALLTGVAAHSFGPHPRPAAAGAGLVLAAHAHAGGWGLPVGGTQAIADALVDELLRAGGSIEFGAEVRDRADVGPSRAVILDTSPEFLDAFGGDRLPIRYRRALGRYRRGPGAAKLDLALSGPVPWRDARLSRVPTVHLGGTRDEIAAAEREVAHGRIPERPYVLVVQPSVVDPRRAPIGSHTLWAYAHVPRGSVEDPTALILDALERAAPGVRDLVLAAAPRTAVGLEEQNPNDVGGDILGGAVTLAQLVRRPVVSREPWRTPLPGVYLCSASTPPGPGVHGMGGWHAARLALRDVFGITHVPYEFAG